VKSIPIVNIWQADRYLYFNQIRRFILIFVYLLIQHVVSFLDEIIKHNPVPSKIKKVGYE
jgi:hypothetical protein